jgi:hypothetical protein
MGPANVFLSKLQARRTAHIIFFGVPMRNVAHRVLQAFAVVSALAFIALLMINACTAYMAPTKAGPVVAPAAPAAAPPPTAAPAPAPAPAPEEEAKEKEFLPATKAGPVFRRRPAVLPADLPAPAHGPQQQAAP